MQTISLPIITDMLDYISEYKFFTKLEISMQYYTFKLQKPSQELCVIVTLFDKHLPMGLICTPDFAQQVMEKVLCNIEDIGLYLDNIGEILHWLGDNGFTVNLLKCKSAIKETDWLAYWLTPTDIKPWHKKIDGILVQIQKPKNLLQMCGFLGAGNHYQGMWPQCTHIFALLSSESGK